jgi:hypothetical protein
VRLEAAYRSDQFQTGANGSLCVILVGLRIAEIHHDPIAHVLRDEAPKAAYGLRDALLIGRNDLAEVFGSMRAERAVEPTKSENITVTWRRSAVSRGAASTATG